MSYRSELHGLCNVPVRSCNPACLRSRKFSLFFYLFLILLVYGVPSHAQSLAISSNPRMRPHRVNGPGNTVDTVITAGMPALCTVMQTWQRNDSIAPSPSAYLMVGSTGQGGGIPPFKGALAELLVFDRSLDVLTQMQYETYLALKYGIPLTSGNYG